MLPILYGYDSKGKVKIWSVATSDDLITVSHGLLHGTIQHKPTRVKGKNLGRSNETTPSQQAKLEALSKWNKQKDKNYHENINSCIPLENPMLAHDYRKQGHRIKFPADTQVKLDGVRCLIKYDYVSGEITFKSRGNKEYTLIPEIVDQVRVIFEKHFGQRKVMLDGELYIHGQSLQTIISAVKKHTDDEGKVKELVGEIKFHLFDVVFLEEMDMLWVERRDEMDYLSSLYTPSRIKYVTFSTCLTEPAIEKLHGKATAMGYEGLMLRNLTGTYSFNSRSPDLQKYKLFIDEEFTCTGVFLDKDGRGGLVLENHNYVQGTDENFKEFKATWKGTHEERQAIADYPSVWIKKPITIQYQTLTDGNVPQFPVAVARRDYE